MGTPRFRFALAVFLGVALAPVSRGGDYEWAADVSGNWSDSGNWAPSGVPGTDPADTATIDATGNAYVVTLNQSRTLGVFTLDASMATLSSAGMTLTVNGPSDLLQGAVIWSASTWAGSGTLTNSTDFTVHGTSFISASFVQNGHVTVSANSPTYIARLRTANGYTNAGDIDVTSTLD